MMSRSRRALPMSVVRGTGPVRPMLLTFIGSTTPFTLSTSTTDTPKQLSFTSSLRRSSARHFLPPPLTPPTLCTSPHGTHKQVQAPPTAVTTVGDHMRRRWNHPPVLVAPSSPQTPPSQPRHREYVHSCCGRGGKAAPPCPPTVAPPLSRSTGVGPAAPSPSTTPPMAAPATRPPPVHPTRPIGGSHPAAAAPPGTTRPREHLTAPHAAAPSDDTLHHFTFRPPRPPCPAAPPPPAPPQTTRLTLQAAPSSATPPSPPARRRQSAPHPSPARRPTVPPPSPPTVRQPGRPAGPAWPARWSRPSARGQARPPPRPPTRAAAQRGCRAAAGGGCPGL